MKILKNNLKKIRFLNGELTQEQLAKSVDVSRQTINSIENGKFNPSVLLALKICKKLNVKVEEIFFIKEKKND